MLDAAEIRCIPDYDDYSFINSYDLDVPQYDGDYLLVKTIYGPDDEDSETELMVLDQGYRVISGAFEADKKKYTEREYRILTGDFPENAELIRTTLRDGRILVAATKKWDIDDYTTIGRKSNMVYWSQLPISLLLIAVIILFLNRSVKNPLM